MNYLNKRVLVGGGIGILSIVLIAGAYFKYVYKTPGQICLGIVTGMFQDIKDGRDVQARVSPEYWEMLTKYDQAYTLTNDAFSEDKTLEGTGDIVIERKGTYNNNQPVSQYFSLEKINNEYKVVNSINYIAFTTPGYQIDDADNFSQSWDSRKARLIESIKQGLKIELTDTTRPYSSDPKWVKGTVKVTNTSNFNISNLWVTIYHYDKDGISISPDTAFISAIPKNGRSETSWLSTNCGECVTHKVEIKTN